MISLRHRVKQLFIFLLIYRRYQQNIISSRASGAYTVNYRTDTVTYEYTIIIHYRVIFTNYIHRKLTYIANEAACFFLRLFVIFTRVAVPYTVGYIIRYVSDGTRVMNIMRTRRTDDIRPSTSERHRDRTAAVFCNYFRINRSAY